MRRQSSPISILEENKLLRRLRSGKTGGATNKVNTPIRMVPGFGPDATVLAFLDITEEDLLYFINNAIPPSFIVLDVGGSWKQISSNVINTNITKAIGIETILPPLSEEYGILISVDNGGKKSSSEDNLSCSIMDSNEIVLCNSFQIINSNNYLDTLIEVTEIPEDMIESFMRQYPDYMKKPALVFLLDPIDVTGR